MNDNEIIKALEQLAKSNMGGVWIIDKALDLINRLKAQNKEFDEKLVIQRGTIDWQTKEINRQKAEIERLQHEMLSCNTKIEVLEEVKEQLEKDVFNAQMNCDSIAYEYELLKQEKTVVQVEAIKNFAERLKEKANGGFWEEHSYVDVEDIDNLVAEMVGDEG